MSEAPDIIELNHPILTEVGRLADASGVQAFVVGGYVRDTLLGKRDSDIDILVLGDGIALAGEFARNRGGLPVVSFERFGTAMVPVEGAKVEFVGARKEAYHQDSRNPRVEAATLQDDLLRRDFTVNALAVSLNRESFGKLFDPLRGREDLGRKLLRTPLDPDATFSDDPLRMLRAIRFACQLDFDIFPETFDAIIRNKERLKIISGERIADELHKMMASRQPSVGFRLLEISGLLEIILPEMMALKGVETKDGVGHKDNFSHTLQVLDNLAKVSDNVWLRWAALFHDVGKPASKRWDPKAGWTFYNHNFLGEKMIPDLFRRLKFPMNEKMKYVKKMVGLHMRPIVLSEEIVTDSAVRRLLFDAGDDIEDLMTLCEADITSKNPDKVKRYLGNFQLVRSKLRELEEKDRIRNMQPPVSGEEIMETFGLRPCREVGMIKEAIKDAILDGVIPNEYPAAREFMFKRASQLGLTPRE